MRGSRCLGTVPFSWTGSRSGQAHDRGTGAVVLAVPWAQEFTDTCVLHATQAGIPPARPAHGGPCEAAQRLGSSLPSGQKAAPCHQISKRSGFQGLSTSPLASSFPWLGMQDSTAWRAPPPNLVPLKFLFLEVLLSPAQPCPRLSPPPGSCVSTLEWPLPLPPPLPLLVLGAPIPPAATSDPGTELCVFTSSVGPEPRETWDLVSPGGLVSGLHASL